MARTEEAHRGDSTERVLVPHAEGGGDLALGGGGESGSAGNEGGGEGELHDFEPTRSNFMSKDSGLPLLGEILQWVQLELNPSVAIGTILTPE